MRRTISAVALVCLLAACVTGAPELTPEQDTKLAGLKAYPPGESPKERFTSIGDVSAADCSGAPAGGRVWGNAENAVDSLKKKAVAAGADAVIDVHCGAAPFLNNCWAAQKCTGQAIRFQ